MNNILRAIVLVMLSSIAFSISRADNYQQQNYSNLFDRTTHHKLHTPSSIKELQNLIRKTKYPICLVGAGKSQGGQTDCAGKYACKISLQKINKLLVLDLRKKEVTVQAGMSWRELQECVAPHRLAIKTMQSYNDFSIGGSLGVNVHGQDPHINPLIASIKSCKIMLADGTVVHASRSENKDLFFGAIGGYGLLGIIIEVTLSLTDDALLDRHITIIDTPDLASFVLTNVKNNPLTHFYSARFSMGEHDLLEKAIVITYEKSDIDAPELFVLNPTLKSSASRKFLVATQKFQSFKNWRLFIESLYHQQTECISRNNFMNASIESLPQDNAMHDYILQEYFIPYAHLSEFLGHLRATIQHYSINMLNVTARHVNQDNESLLAFAPKEYCALVLYLPAGKHRSFHQPIVEWTRSLIDKALALGGTYYLPYHLLATQQQFETAYPKFKQFIHLKKRFDPLKRFNNKLYQQYATNRD